MAELKKYEGLLYVLLALLFLKFVYVPVIEWQDRLIAKNYLEQKKIIKSQFAIDNQALIVASLDKMQQKREVLTELLFDFKKDNVFQLEQQQWLEQVFEKHEVEISNLGWQASESIQRWNVIQHQVDIRFKGKVIDVKKIHLLINSQSKWVDLSEFNFRFSKKRKSNLGQITGRMTLYFYTQEQDK
ncbi:hypothetical protein HR060_08515 [Catenovulum sp. SM1970]|uniref:hypothetical protein n=1 Tax=Marinifaba aquimaris TaxID=2741323 RepID=UPI001571A2F9|nr:hypothetical protein [Marinifaba aquimaris]NTS76912.1 hypothetical protein [Marinifaba aquimaris]